MKKYVIKIEQIDAPIEEVKKMSHFDLFKEKSKNTELNTSELNALNDLGTKLVEVGEIYVNYLNERLGATWWAVETPPTKTIHHVDNTGFMMLSMALRTKGENGKNTLYVWVNLKVKLIQKSDIVLYDLNTLYIDPTEEELQIEIEHSINSNKHIFTDIEDFEEYISKITYPEIFKYYHKNKLL